MTKFNTADIERSSQTSRDDIKQYGFDPSPYYNGLDKQVRADDLDGFAWRLLNAYSNAMGISGLARSAGDGK